ncbi:hypothetical protein TIFTF001_037709 [Ficus carica]|uniref:Uncharacterized protein n=1 Tax=Ficus carica TaxID=3494 RepID=A0AA88E6H8_FICCA|nr:hypothetical protein TIFTF001_037709 [Ficus carica]
MEDDEQKQ